MKLSVAIQEFDLSLIGVVSPASRSLYGRQLRALIKFLGDVAIDEITISDLRRWRADLVDRRSRWVGSPYRPEAPGALSPWTIHGYVRTARRFFKWLTEEGLLEQNPAIRLELPILPDEPPKGLSDDDLHRLLDAARDNPRNYAVICLLADTGARLGAIANLRMRDLELEAQRALVHDKGRGGRRKARYIYFSKRTKEALEVYLRARSQKEDDTVFISTRGGRWTENGIRQMLKRLAKKAGVKGRSNPHSFRHGWARAALRNGADLGTVSQVLGHADIEVTARFYARWYDHELQERHNRFTWLK